jgi:hypothetical protein
MLGLKVLVGAFSLCFGGDSAALVLKAGGFSSVIYPEFLNELVNTGLKWSPPSPLSFLFGGYRALELSIPYVIPDPPDAAVFEFISSLWFRLMPPLPIALAF